LGVILKIKATLQSKILIIHVIEVFKNDYLIDESYKADKKYRLNSYLLFLYFNMKLLSENR